MPESMPSACRVCGGVEGARHPVGDGDHAWHCDRCGWRLGDAPDADLPTPRVSVVYYLRYAQRVKIGTSATPRARLAAIRHEELLAFEQGGRDLEQQRHRQFAALREGGEWFTLAAPLVDHIDSLRTGRDPWATYDRWLGDALRARSA